MFVKTDAGWYNINYIILAEWDDKAGEPRPLRIETVTGQHRTFTGVNAEILVRALDDMVGRGTLPPTHPEDVTHQYPLIRGQGEEEKASFEQAAG